MKQILALSLFCSFLSAAEPAEMWTFPCEAEKGERTAQIPRKLEVLEFYTRTVPRYSADPLEDNATILKSTAKTLGSFDGRQITEVRLELKEGFYTDFYLLICEVKPGLYLPVYGQQYNRDTRKPSFVGFSSDSKRCSITVEMKYSGTARSRTTDVVTLTKGETQDVQLAWEQKE